MSSLTRSSVYLSAALILTIGAGAQSFSGKITGNVTDSSGGAVPNAAVTILNEGTGAERSLVTDLRGLYVASELPIGYYTVRLEAPRFNKVELVHVKVDVGAETRADATLSAQTIEQSVTVNAEAPILQRDSSSLAEVIDNRRVDSLPLNGRDFRKLAFLVPGVSPRSPRGSLGSFTVNGQREKSNIFLIDGVDNNDSFRNQPSFNQGGPVNAQATILPVDALAEFSIQTQGSAEYGRNSGAIVNTVLKSGTNAVHGSAYEFLRHDKLNARNFFETLPGAPKRRSKTATTEAPPAAPSNATARSSSSDLRANAGVRTRRLQYPCPAIETSPRRATRIAWPAGPRIHSAPAFSACIRTRTIREPEAIMCTPYRTF